METLFTKTVPYLACPQRLIRPAYESGRRFPALLASGGEVGRWSRYSIFASDPVFRFSYIDERIHLEAFTSDSRDLDGDPFDFLQTILRRLAEARDGATAQAGLIGYLGYEAGRHLERLPEPRRDPYPLPEMSFAYYPWLLVFDRETQTAHLEQGSTGSEILQDYFGAADSAEIERLTADSIAWTLHCCAKIEEMEPLESRNKTVSIEDFPAGWELSVDKAQYLDSIKRIKEYICAGDIYQANYTLRMTRRFDDDAARLFETLCRINPAWYSAYLDGGDFQIVSASPELFLHSDGSRVVTRPIKGTLARDATGNADEAEIEQLKHSEKDRAEHIMIVDLERNDLGRVCRYHSVRVSELAAVETLPTLHHLTSTVEGRLREGVDGVDLIRAMFPGGSITGAPKIRSMEIIHELEPVPRGVYTGAIGLLTPDGDINMSIAIRTLVVTQGHVMCGVGGGIVADSQPGLEWEECLHKGRNLARAVLAVENECD